MTQRIDPCDTARNNVIAAALALQQCTKTAANIIPLPGTDNVIAIGMRAWIAKNVPGVEVEPTEVALGRGLIEVGQGHHGHERLPAILFGRNGAGAVGVETEGDRFMEPGECIVAITFENAASLDVVAEKLAELRARIWPDVAATTQASTAQAEPLLVLQQVKQWDIDGWKERGFALPTELRAKIQALVGDAPAATSSTAQAEARELAVQLRSAHDREIWDWGYLLNAATMIEKLATIRTDAQAAAEVRDAWISVDERLPAMWKEVMVWPYPTDYCMTAELVGESASGNPVWKYGEYTNGWGHETLEMTRPVTHWMLLPAAPSALRAGDTGEQADGGGNA